LAFVVLADADDNLYGIEPAATETLSVADAWVTNQGSSEGGR